MPSPFDPVITVVSQIAVVGSVVMAVAAVLAAVYVVHIGAANVISALRGDGRIYRGKFYSNDVWKSALNDLHTRQRGGELLDKDSLLALRQYQGIREQRRRSRGAL